MKSCAHTILMAAIVFSIGCAKKEETKPLYRNPDAGLTEKLGDFAKASEIRMYDKETLWQYNDGAAERYLELGFEKMATADYRADSLEATVEVYAFAAQSGAEGIYNDNVAPGEASPETGEERTLEIGDSGFVSEGLLLFYMGNVFVQINCYNPDPPDAVLIKLARALEQNLKSGS